MASTYFLFGLLDTDSSHIFLMPIEAKIIFSGLFKNILMFWESYPFTRKKVKHKQIKSFSFTLKCFKSVA